MLFTLSLLLLLTPLPSLQTTTNEKRNSTGSDTIKTDAVLTTSIPRTMATLAKQKLHTTPTPHTSNHTILTISTTKQKLPTVNVAKTAKIKKLSTVIHTTTSTATKQVTASGTAAIKGDHTASVNTTVLVLKSPANSDIKTIRDKSTTSVGQNVQSTPTKLASGSGPKTAKDKLTLSTNQTVSIKSPAISSVKTSVKIPSTPTKSATGSSAKDKLITSVNQTVSIKSPSVNGTNKVTVAKTALSTSSKPAIASGTVVNKVKHTTLVNQTASVKTSLLNNVKAVTEKPALAVVKTTLSTLTKVVTASDTMASTNKQEASVSKTASSSSMKPTTEKLPLTPVKTSLSTPTSTKTVTANGTVTNKDKQTASVNQTASLKTGTSNAKTTADKPVLTVVRTALSMPILAKPATASSTTTNKDKYNASTNQTALGKTNTSHVRTMTDKPVLTMSKTAHSTPTSAKPVAANGSMTNKIKQTASVNKTASIKTSTSNVKTMADKPALKVVKTVLPTSTKSPAASGAAARKDKGTVSVDQTEVIKSPASSPVKTTDKPMPPIKVLITDSCDSSQHKEQELKLKPGSPLVMTHKISLMPGGCTGGCVAEMAALVGRVERLEKEMSSVKDKCPCSVNCPNDCSGNGKCEKGKCVCLQGFLGPDCSRCSPGADCHNKTKKEKVKIDVEVVTTAVSQDSNTVQENGKKAEKTLLQKKEQKKGSEGKELDATPKVATTVKVGLIKTQAKQASSVTKTNIKGSVSTKTVQPTVGQVLLKHKGRKQEEARKGRTTFLTAKDPQPKPDIKHVTVKEGTSAKANTKSGHLQDQPHTNETLSIIKMSNDTAKVPTIRTKVAETSNNKTSVGKETLEQSTLAEKNVTQSPAIKLNKKVKTEHLNVTKVVQFVQNTKTETGGSGKDKAMQKSQYLVNVTSVESRDESKVLQNKTALQFSGNATRRAGGAGLGSVKVANITSYSFTFTWYAPQGMFKNFTVIRREYREEEEEEAHLDGETAAATAKNTTEGQTQRESINATSAKVSGSRGKAEGQRVSMVLPGSVRSIEFGHLQPQTRYSLQVFGTSPGKRSKIHRVTVTTGPEPATELVFSSVTESSLTVSWSKPKGMFAGFRVTYTNYVTGESSFEIVNSKKSHVVLSKLSAGSSYVISVTTIQGQLQSDALTSTITTVPAPLTYLQAVNVTDTRALLQWTPSPGKVDRFIITYESSKTPNVTVTVMLSGNSVEHQLRGLQRGTLYTVKALSQKGSLQSTSISTTFTTANVVKASEVGARSAVIAWKASTIAFHSYRLTYQVAGEEIQELNLEPTITEYKLTGLVAMTRYIILVQGERDGKYTSVVTTDFMTGNLRFPHPTECSQELLNGALQSGEVDIYPHGKEGAAVRVYCDMETDGGGWTVFQRRMNGKADFFRTWSEYRAGFGNLSEEFWLGNELLHNLTSVGPVSLRVDLRVGNDTAYAHYSNFTVDTEENHYTLMLSGYTGTAGDSMRYHNGRPFSTRDKDPDTLGIHCAKAYMGGWWYKNCYKTNLNGLYGTNTNNQGVVWIDWKGKDSSIPFTEMMFRPSGFSPATQG